MTQFLDRWWPTLGCAAIVVFFAGVTWWEIVHHHRSAISAGVMTVGFSYLLFREIRRT